MCLPSRHFETKVLKLDFDIQRAARYRRAAFHLSLGYGVLVRYRGKGVVGGYSALISLFDMPIT